jgi:hypothetical protein
MAGVSSERQESGLIRKIKTAVKSNKNNPITILFANGQKLTGVTDAIKFASRQISGSEPYTDVVIFQGKKKINLSLKGESAPSLAGGGLRGIETVVPGLGAKFFKSAYNHAENKLKLNIGDKVPDLYGKIPSRLVEDIVVGNVEIGGPINYMYIGPMNVIGPPYDLKNNILKVNGNLYEAKEYSKKHTFYFRLRARREDQRFDPNAKDAKGIPKIYGKSPSRGDSAGRLVVISESSLPKNAEIINIK